MTTTEALTTAALDAAARGWRVFPLRPGDKRPVNGFTAWERHATTDPARIRGFWGHGVPYNIAIACGPSNLIVLDLDRPKAGEAPPPEWKLPGVGDGADVLAVLCEHHGQPWPADTFTVRTRRGGMHLYFTAPPGARLTNTAGGSARSLGWRIDTRAHGGYVVAAGSIVNQPDGAGSYDVIHDVPPAPLPQWLSALLSPATRPSPALECPTPAGLIGDLSAYVRAALQAEAERVATAVRGGRNHALNKAAYNLGRLVGAGALPEPAAASALYEAASVHFGPTGDDITPTEAHATIRSGLRDGARNPRTITEPAAYPAARAATRAGTSGRSAA